jgi:uncharacterized protein (DUF983 family)
MTVTIHSREPRNLWQAIGRGLRGRCPHCGQGKLFRAFLKVADHCEVCGEEFHHHRADDLPAYLSIVIVGHVVIFLMIELESWGTISPLAYLLTLVPLSLVLALVLLQPIKGAVVGLQWANRMHGFDSDTTHPDPAAPEKDWP